jgi:hypothetical protein
VNVLVGSSLLGFDLENRRQVDLIGPEDNNVIPVIPQLPLRGVGFSPCGKLFYAAINKQVLVYDAISRVQLDLGDPGTPEKEGRDVGEPVYSATGHTLVPDPQDLDSFFADIPGTPTDLEVRNLDDPVDPGKEAIIYTTSVQLLSGECPSGEGMAPGGMEPLGPIVPDPDGGGCCGGPNHRVVLLSAIDMDRPNGFAGASRTGSVEISCVTVAGTPEILEYVGLDIAEDGRIFVVSEDSGMLTTVATDSAGLLVPSSLISVPVIRDLQLDTDPVATVIRYDRRFAYVALRGTSEVRVLDLESEDVLGPPIPVAGSLGKLAIQRQDP